MFFIAVMTICPVACQACNILRGILWMRITKEASLASLANLHNNNVLKLNQTIQFFVLLSLKRSEFTLKFQLESE